MAELKIEQLLRAMVDNKASDLHIRTGVPPIYRINGALTKIFETRVDPGMMDSFLDDIMNRDQKLRFEQNKECDFAVGARDMGRFRVNVFRQRGTIAIVIRHIKAKIPAFEELHLPEIIRDMALTRRGLVLVTGTTGSGKSTTLASMLDYINQREAVNIITVEDPIEYLYRDEKAIISQREIGVDTLSYANALRAALRQDPDVLLVGEIRDLETMQIALTAADTGHMVFATIHTTNATETIQRVLSFHVPAAPARRNPPALGRSPRGYHFAAPVADCRRDGASPRCRSAREYGCYQGIHPRQGQVGTGGTGDCRRPHAVSQPDVRPGLAQSLPDGADHARDGDERCDEQGRFRPQDSRYFRYVRPWLDVGAYGAVTSCELLVTRLSYIKSFLKAATLGTSNLELPEVALVTVVERPSN